MYSGSNTTFRVLLVVTQLEIKENYRESSLYFILSLCGANKCLSKFLNFTSNGLFSEKQKCKLIRIANFICIFIRTSFLKIILKVIPAKTKVTTLFWKKKKKENSSDLHWHTLEWSLNSCQYEVFRLHIPESIYNSVCSLTKKSWSTSNDFWY